MGENISGNKKRWSYGSVVYHIYPRSFKDSNGDGIGDLNGITEKLDYIKNLGLDAIWLSPFYKSPMADFGYDIADYTLVDPMFGTLADFDNLLKKAHQRGIKMLVDFVPNHTSNQHPWFLESKSSRNNPKRAWYLWADGNNSEPPNNWISVFGGTGWEFDSVTNQYYYHSFLKEQPDLNWHNPEVRAAMKDVLRFWLNRGVDGFRVDAIHWLTKDKEFRDDPVNPNYQAGREDPYHQFLHERSMGQEETYKVLAELCEVLQEYDDKFMVTEVHTDIPTMAKYYRACPPGLQSPFNFNLIGMPWQAGVYKKFVDDFEASLMSDDNPNYVLGNHDQPRVASRLGQDRARLSVLLQMTLRGMPFVYYGDELGMENGIIPPEFVQDPFEKRIPGLGLGRDPQRTPMQWNTQEHAGFSQVKPWLPINSNYQHINVEVEEKDSRSMLALYKFLINCRKRHPALLFGRYEVVTSANQDLFCYRRISGNDKFLIVLNFSDQPQTLTEHNIQATIIVNTLLDRPEGESVNLMNFVARGYEGYMFKI